MVKMAQRPFLVHKRAISQFARLGKARDYYTTVQRVRGKLLTAPECAYLVAHHSDLEGVFPTTWPGELSSVELGEALLARGEAGKALKVFRGRKLATGMVKCLLALKRYRECATLLKDGTLPGQPTVEDTVNFARAIGACVADEWEQYLLTDTPLL